MKGSLNSFDFVSLALSRTFKFFITTFIIYCLATSVNEAMKGSVKNRELI